MLAIEDHILSFQGHVEFDVAYAKDLLEMRRSILGEDTYLKASDSLKETTENAKVTDWILKFLQKRLKRLIDLMINTERELP